MADLTNRWTVWATYFEGSPGQAITWFFCEENCPAWSRSTLGLGGPYPEVSLPVTIEAPHGARLVAHRGRRVLLYRHDGRTIRLEADDILHLAERSDLGLRLLSSPCATGCR